MKLSDLAVAALKKTAERDAARNIHPEDSKVYNQGLWDGHKLMAEWVLEQLEEVENERLVPDESFSELG